MTEMRAREVWLNLILALAVSALGLVMRLLGTLGHKKNLLLPEYALTIKGVGGAVLAIGLLWLGLALLKRLLQPPERPPR